MQLSISHVSMYVGMFFDIGTAKSDPKRLHCAWPHGYVPSFDIATSKSGLVLVWFVHFDLNMCFVPQQIHVSSNQGVSAPAILARLLDFLTLPTHKSFKNTAIRDFPNISRGCIFFLTVSHLHLLSSDWTSLLCFSSLHIVGSLTSKTSFDSHPNSSIYHFYTRYSLLSYVTFCPPVTRTKMFQSFWTRQWQKKQIPGSCAKSGTPHGGCKSPCFEEFDTFQPFPLEGELRIYTPGN